jgi:2-dehydro-3-deoxy-L-rhamnonate dehydrogenase (NAD+)
MTVLVTGASSGIGLCIARRFVDRGERVLMLSHDRAELGNVCVSPFTVPVLCDLSDPAQVRGLWKRLETEHGPIDILVNNAGVGHHGEVEATDEETFRRLMEVNFFAAVSLCQQAVAAMKPRGSGKILNLTSASARRPLARMGAYGSSKAALHGFTQTLRAEVQRHGIFVGEVLPISVKTAFFQRASNTSDRVYRPKGVNHTPEEVAQMVMRCLDRRIAEIVSHRPTQWGIVLDALMPNTVARLLAWLERKTAKAPK